MNRKTRKILRAGAWVLFGVYLLLLCYFLFFAETLGRTHIDREYRYNMYPFREIKRCIKYWHALGMKTVCINLFGNIAAFVPFGLFVPLLSHKQRYWWRVVLLSFDFSLIVELLQLVSKVGSFDVDDLLLNTIGGFVGYLCFICAEHLHRRGAKKRETGIDGKV